MSTKFFERKYGNNGVKNVTLNRKYIEKTTFGNTNIKPLTRYFKTVTRYDEFISVIQGLRNNIGLSKNTSLNYGWFIDDDYDELYLFTHKNDVITSDYSSRHDAENVSFICKYHVETPKILAFIKQATNIADGEVKFATATRSNYKEIIYPFYMLELILCVYSLQSRGEKLYHEFQIPKKSGGMRDIIAPHQEYKKCLKHLNVMLQNKFDKINDKFQVAYKKNKSIYDNALPHIYNKYVYKVDFSNFFTSCSRELVYSALEFMIDKKSTGYTNDLLTYGYNIFIDCLLKDDALFMGNPISGTVANYIISKPVQSMYQQCKALNIAMTVYADDITFSSSKYLHKDFVLKILNSAFEKCELHHYFKISENKCYGQINNKRNITGVVVNHLDEISCKRKMYNACKVTLHQLENNLPTKLTITKLRGNLSHIHSIDRSGKFIKLCTEYYDVLVKNKIFSETTLYNMMNNNTNAKLQMYDYLSGKESGENNE